MHEYANGVPNATPSLDEAQILPLGELVGYEQPTKYIVCSTDYSDDFDIPVLTAGQSFILGYTDEQEGICMASKKNPVIIFDDFTGAFKWVDFPFKVKSSAMKILHANEGKAILRYVYYTMWKIGISSNEHKRLWIQFYSNIEIPIPPIEEQERIVSILDKFDSLCNDLSEGLPAEIEARRKQYEHYRDRIFESLEERAT